MAGVRLWLGSVLSASLVCALAGALMPPGAVKRVGKLTCALVLAAAVLSPLVRLDLEGGQRWLEDYFAALEARQAELSGQTAAGMKTIIEDRFAAYILDKAEQLGVSCTSARVECQVQGETLLPVHLWAGGVTDPEGRERLARALEEELGIPRAQQDYSEEESP